MNHKQRALTLVCLGLMLLSLAPIGHAQEDENDFLNMSLDELMEVEGIPIDVLATHIHPKGEWMIRYRFMTMTMNDNRVGTDLVSVDDVLEAYRVSPTRMTMQMHMVDVMYGWTDDLTLMAMVPLLESSMDHVTRNGSSFTTDATGLSDISLMAHYNISIRGTQRVVYLGGIRLPTGTIDAKDDTPAGNAVLPYPMQLGSGTYDLVQGVSYHRDSKDWGWGADVKGSFRLGRNRSDYSLGNRFESSIWGARRLSDWSSVSVRFVGERWGDVSGSDPRLNPAFVPTAAPELRGGFRLDAGVWSSAFSCRGALFRNSDSLSTLCYPLIRILTVRNSGRHTAFTSDGNGVSERLLRS